MKRLVLIILTLVIIFLASQCNGITIFVDDDAPDCGDGKSWQTAYKYLQDALSAAQSGYQILVAAGTYRPDCNCANPNGTGDRTATFQIKNNISVYGGFAGIGTPDPNFRDPNLYDKTILSGDLDGNDVDVNDPCDLLNEPTRAENSYHVVATINAGSTTILDGFIITAGNANGSARDNYYGGGMYRSGSINISNCTFAKNSSKSGGGAMYNTSNPNLTDCKFTKNSDGIGGMGGGAIFNYSCSPTFTDCKFSMNQSNSGGAMNNYNYASPKLTNCEFSRNQGGAISNFYSWLTLNNCIFIKNQRDNGGAMSGMMGQPTLTHCTFIENSAKFIGGAMYNTYHSPIIIDCTFSKNQAKNGGVMYNNYGGPTLTNCIFTENVAKGGSGGAIYNYRSTPNINNSLFAANLSDGSGGAIYNEYYSNTEMTNCTLTKNGSISPGGAIYNSSDCDPNLINCILWLDTPDEICSKAGSDVAMAYSDVQGGWPGVSNIDEDPCFVKPGYWADANDPNIVVEPNDPNAVWMEGDYNMLSNSPCIDAGDSNAVPSGIWTDLDGEPRFVDDPNTADSGVGTPPIVDMGSYEFQDNVFKIGECYPQTYSTYRDWLTLGKPNCWCGMYLNPPWQYQCDGDTDNLEQVVGYRIYTNDLTILSNNWKKKITDHTLNPCADFDHKGQVVGYRVYTNDLTILSNNWKKKAGDLPGKCPRPK